MRFCTRASPKKALLAEVAWAEIFSNDAAWAIWPSLKLTKQKHLKISLPPPTKKKGSVPTFQSSIFKCFWKYCEFQWRVIYHRHGYGCHGSKYWKVDVKGPIIGSTRLNNFGYHFGTAFLVDQILSSWFSTPISNFEEFSRIAAQISCFQQSWRWKSHPIWKNTVSTTPWRSLQGASTLWVYNANGSQPLLNKTTCECVSTCPLVRPLVRQYA